MHVESFAPRTRGVLRIDRTGAGSSVVLAPIQETAMKSSDSYTLTAGLAAAGAAIASTHKANATVKPKSAREIKIVALFGTTERSNGISHELHIRGIFESKKDWRLVFIRANRLFTPDLIRDADLFIVGRDAGPDPVDLFANGAGVVDKIIPGSSFWTDSNVDAVMDNVQNRGMGLIAMQGTVLCGHQKFMTFLDVAGIEPHAIEPMWYTRFDKSHPIIKGVGKFSVLHDEQPLVIIKSASTATLFESTAVHEKRQGVSGWALERGKGRIAGLLPGSTTHAYKVPEYRTIIWRAAHWAMKRDIPICPGEMNRYYV
jgi:hypothetical protein